MRPFPLFLALSLLFFVSLPARADDLDSFRADALAQINAFRQQQGLGPVVLDDTLNRVSLDWARHLVQVGSMVHRDHDNLGQLLRQNKWGTINENLFFSKPASSAAVVVNAWKKSPPHRRNLLDPQIDRIGLGNATSGDGSFFAVFNGAGKPKESGFAPGFGVGVGL